MKIDFDRTDLVRAKLSTLIIEYSQILLYKSFPSLRILPSFHGNPGLMSYLPFSDILERAI